MTTRLRSTLTLLALLTTAVPVAAQSVVNNGTPNGQAGWDIFDDYRAADDFTFGGTLSFDLIRFWALLPSSYAASTTIFWEILNDAGAGAPGATILASGSTLAQQTLRSPLAFDFNSWQFDLAVGPQSLGAGIYWLALHDGALGESTGSTLLWEMTSQQSGSQFAVEALSNPPFTGDMGGDLAFELLMTDPAVVPEPATIALLATGLIGIAAARRRRRRQ